MMEDLKSIQRELENEAMDRGLQRSQEALDALRGDGDVLAHKPYQRLTKASLPLVSKAIQGDLRAWGEKGRGKRPVHVTALGPLDPDVTAYIGLLGAFQGLTQNRDYRATAIDIADMVEDELRLLALQEDDEKAAKYIKVKATTRRDMKGRRKALSSMLSKQEKGRWSPWPQDTKLRVGGYILSMVIQHSSVFALYKAPGEDRRFITVTEEAQEFLTDLESKPIWFKPVLLPMVVPPKPWKGYKDGGYLTEDLQSRVHFVRTRDPEHQQMIEKAFQDGSIDPVAAAVNRIQETPFRINKKILEMVQWAFDKDLVMDKFPRRSLLPLPEVPEGYDEMPEEDRKIFRQMRAETHIANRGILGEQAVFANDMITAQRMAQFEAFYLPHNLDFRGRVYPIPPFNHQRADHIQALFEFSRGYALGEDGGYWLAIHLANCGDFDKVSKKGFGERIEWVMAHREQILAVARDPKANLWWTEADKPFGFLAACLEWQGYEEQGVEWVCHLPVSFDGSNSGIQHYSAALRSASDGQHVNLIPQDQPSDMYALVAEKVLKVAEADAAAGDEVAQLWLDYGITRSVVKRPAMTFAYSSEAYGFKQQILTDLMDPLAREVKYKMREAHPFGDRRTQFVAAGYLAKVIYAATVDTVQDAATGMRYFQKMAGALAHESKPVTWVTPLGFPVLHKYTEWETKQIRLTIYDRRIDVLDVDPDETTEEGFAVIKSNVRVKPTPRIVKAKQRSAIAPNIIHSMDATHLLKAVNYAYEKHGIQDFFLIHDSFGSPAGQADDWFEVIREAFVDLYEDCDIFEVVDKNAREVLSEKGLKRLPELPSKGSLDIRKVRESLYTFA